VKETQREKAIKKLSPRGEGSRRLQTGETNGAKTSLPPRKGEENACGKKLGTSKTASMNMATTYRRFLPARKRASWRGSPGKSRTANTTGNPPEPGLSPADQRRRALAGRRGKGRAHPLRGRSSLFQVGKKVLASNDILESKKKKGHSGKLNQAHSRKTDDSPLKEEGGSTAS